MTKASKPAATERTEYDRFRDLAQRLVRVPKREIDEARKREEREKAQRAR